LADIANVEVQEEGAQRKEIKKNNNIYKRRARRGGRW